MKMLMRRIAATVTRGAVRCSAWLGDVETEPEFIKRLLQEAREKGERLYEESKRSLAFNQELFRRRA